VPQTTTPLIKSVLSVLLTTPQILLELVIASWTTRVLQVVKLLVTRLQPLALPVLMLKHLLLLVLLPMRVALLMPMPQLELLQLNASLVMTKPLVELVVSHALLTVLVMLSNAKLVILLRDGFLILHLRLVRLVLRLLTQILLPAPSALMLISLTLPLVTVKPPLTLPRLNVLNGTVRSVLLVLLYTIWMPPLAYARSVQTMPTSVPPVVLVLLPLV